MKIKIKCDYCNKLFYRKRHIAMRQKHNFCNHKCYIKFRFFGFKKIVKCDYCKIKFEKYKIEIKSNKHNFCSRQCSALWVKKFLRGVKHPTFSGKVVKCLICNKKKLVHKKGMNKNKHYFCSQKCFKIFIQKEKIKNIIIIKCDYCKKKLSYYKSQIKKAKHHFCNRLCKENWESIFFKGKNHPNYINGGSFYPSEFNNKLREFIRKRDSHRCQNLECGIPQLELLHSLDVHHIDYNKKNCDPINLIALCRKCHVKTKFNHKYWQNYYENIQIKRKVHELEKYDY